MSPVQKVTLPLLFAKVINSFFKILISKVMFKCLFCIFLAYPMVLYSQENACNSRNYDDIENQVQLAYIGYYGRPADAGGLRYWVDRLRKENGQIGSIIEAFGNSDEFIERYGSLTNRELIRGIYQQLFGRDPEAAGWDFWTDALERGVYTLPNITLAVMSGALNEDVVVLDNRLVLARLVTTEIESVPTTAASLSAETLADWIRKTGSSSISLQTQCNAVNSYMTSQFGEKVEGAFNVTNQGNVQVLIESPYFNHRVMVRDGRWAARIPFVEFSSSEVPVKLKAFPSDSPDVNLRSSFRYSRLQYHDGALSSPFTNITANSEYLTIGCESRGEDVLACIESSAEIDALDVDDSGVSHPFQRSFYNSSADIIDDLFSEVAAGRVDSDLYWPTLFGRIIEGQKPTIFVNPTEASDEILIPQNGVFSDLSLSVISSENLVLSESNKKVSWSPRSGVSNANLEFIVISPNGNSSEHSLNFSYAESVIQTVNTLLEPNNTQPLTSGRMQFIPANDTFTETVALKVSEVKPLQSDIQEELLDIYHVDLNGIIHEPIALKYKVPIDVNYEYVRLVHVDPVSKVETYISPDSYDDAKRELTFLVGSFSWIAAINKPPIYTLADRITLDDLRVNRKEAFAHIEAILDHLDDSDKFSSVQNQCRSDSSKIEPCKSYWIRLASHSLISFLKLSEDVEKLNSELSGLTYSHGFLSSKNTSVIEQYFKLYNQFQGVALKLVNGKQIRLSSVKESYGSEVDGSFVAVNTGLQYMPMLAYKMSLIGRDDAESSMSRIWNYINSKPQSDRANYCNAALSGANAYEDYIFYSVPKVLNLSKNANLRNEVNEIQRLMISQSYDFLQESWLSEYRGTFVSGLSNASFLGTVYVAYENISTTKSLMELTLRHLNSTISWDIDATDSRFLVTYLGNVPTFKCLSGCFGSSANQRWFERGEFLIPPEANTEINNIKKWQETFKACANNSISSNPTPPVTNPEPQPNLGSVSTPSATQGDFDDRIRISWSKVDNATRYDLYRCTTTLVSSCRFIHVAMGTSTNFSFNDTSVDVLSGETFYYRIKASNISDETGYSQAASGYVKNQSANTYTLRFSTSGKGNITFTDPDQIIYYDCDETYCYITFQSGVTIGIKALPFEDSSFLNWSGACTGTNTTCNLTMDQDKTILASFTQPNDDSGSGELIAGRYEVIEDGSVVRDIVTGLEWQRCSVGQIWTGSTCSGTASTHTWDQAIELTAPGGFRIPTIEELRTIVYCSNTGNFGTNGINTSCGSQGNFDRPAIVLEAFPNTHWASEFWSGSPYSPPYSTNAWKVYFNMGFVGFVGMSHDDQVRLVRDSSGTTINHPLSVSRSGTGSGIITSSPSGINCGSSCSASFSNNQLVTLTANPASGSSFSGWSGSCSGTSSTCTVTMNQARNVSASFAQSTGGGSSSNELIAGRYQVMGSNGDIIRDVVTGLEWQRCSLGQTWNGSSCSGTAIDASWNYAFQLVASVQDGFRIPSKDELATLVYCEETNVFGISGYDYECGNGGSLNNITIVLEAFPNTRNWSYWSSNTAPNSDAFAYAINFISGNILYGDKDHRKFIRLVK